MPVQFRHNPRKVRENRESGLGNARGGFARRAEAGAAESRPQLSQGSDSPLGIPAVGFAQPYHCSLNFVVKYDNMPLMARNTRPISWIKAARKDFEAFPLAAQVEMARALTILAEGQMPEIAKPLTGFGSGVMELALRHRGDALRVVYALQIGDDIWVVHAFQKKSKSGIKTPKQDIDLIHERLRRLKEMLR